MNQNKICIYAITKNEEKFVDKWYESVKEADLVLVLDTGSTDNTVKKLKDKGVMVYQKEIKPWRFDVARNEALRLIPKEYNILFSIDLDETLDKGWANVLRSKWIDGKHTRATYKYAWSHDEYGNPGRIFRYDKIHSWDWEWRYPVHELLWNTKTNTNLYKFEDTLDLFNDIYLHHYPDLEKPRTSYLPLLEQREKENTEDYYGLIYLAHEYYYRGFYQKSINKLYYILQNYSDRLNTTERASCFLFMGDSYMKLNSIDQAMSAYVNSIFEDNTYREPYIALAQIYYNKNQFLLSYNLLKTALKNTYRHYSWLERDSSWTYELYDLLARSAYYTFDTDYHKDAITYAALAMKESPQDERLKNNFNIILNNIESTDVN